MLRIHKLKEYRFGRFLVIAVFLGIIKQMLVSQLPIYAIPAGMMDDALMVRGARSLLQGGFTTWLGPYDQFTLVKGFFFPAFLALIRWLGISYIDAVTVFYTLSCILFVIGISRLFRSNLPLYFTYLVLLFNPATFAGGVLQRVYRNSITQAQVLIILGCVFAMYLRRKEPVRKIIPWALGAGLAWASLEHSREDTVWLLPFMAAALMISAISVLRVKRKISPGTAVKAAVFVLPFVIFSVSHPAVSYVNGLRYGLASYNELNDSHFADAMKAIYGVKLPEDSKNPFVTASRKKLRVLYEVSPSLKMIQDSLERIMDGWDPVDRTPGDSEVEDGWFFWAFREAAAENGFHENAVKADQYYQSVAEEIRSATDAGKLNHQPVMPSALMPPWKEGRTKDVLNAFIQIFPYVASYQEMRAEMQPSIDNPPGGIANFEELTGNRTIDASLPPDDPYLMHLSSYIRRLDAVTALYRYTGIFAAIIGVLSYLAVTVRYIRTLSRKDSAAAAPIWLVLTGLLGGMLCLFGGVAYNHAASCYSITYMYLCAGYPLLIAFWTLGAGFLAENLKKGDSL